MMLSGSAAAGELVGACTRVPLGCAWEYARVMKFHISSRAAHYFGPDRTVAYSLPATDARMMDDNGL